MSEKDEETFLNRWSRRKALEETDHKNIDQIDQELQTDVKIVSLTDDDLTPAQIEAKQAAEEAEMAENLAAAEAVDLDTLNYDSDFQLFMKKGIPDALKNQAMRKLWVSNPILANVDGLNDYDENFADPALNTFKSIWQVGRGFLTDEDDKEKIIDHLTSIDDDDPDLISDAETGTEAVNIENETTENLSNEIDATPQIVKSEKEELGQDNKQTPAGAENTSSEMSENVLVKAEVEQFREEEEPIIKRVSLRKRLLES